MNIIHTKKREEVLDTPILLFECTLPDGNVERWSSHRVTADGHEYEPRLLSHGDFHLGLVGEESLDAGSRFHLVLSNVDGRVSQIDQASGWNGAKLRARFGFFDLDSGQAVSELKAVFVGLANPVEELGETTARLSFVNRLSLLRSNVPELRIQQRCPWRFPVNDAERIEAVGGGSRGRYSTFHGCGYSAGVDGGVGNLANGLPFTDCDHSRADCEARGMFRLDQQGSSTARFGGFQFLPPSVMVRAYGDKSSRLSDAVDGRARSNDAVPLVYGTGWVSAPVIFARNDGNLTHCEVLVAQGPIDQVLRVVASGVALPPGEAGKDMTGTGWYNILSMGGRNGAENLDFVDVSGQPLGDPHGGVACLSVVIPNRNLGSSGLPRIDVLVDGLRLPHCDADGAALPAAFTRNPSWVVLDLLRRHGWRDEDLNLASFAATAAYCDEGVAVPLADGQERQTARFAVNLVIQQRRSLVDFLRGLRCAASLLLTVDEDGRLMAGPETTIAKQHSEKRDGSNAEAAISGGWPAYEFGDGTSGRTGILRQDSGKSTFRIWRRAASEVPNRLTVEYQDSLREYAQDTLSLVDYEEVERRGMETSAPSSAIGLPHFDQAARILRLQLQRGIAGNHFIEFESSVQAFGLRPGDLIAVTHAREGLDRALYRILRLTPAVNFERVKVVAQRHEDRWYALAGADIPADSSVWQESAGTIGTPRPLAGRVRTGDGEEAFEIQEQSQFGSDGSATVMLTARFNPPPKRGMASTPAPLLGLTPEIHVGGGSMTGGLTYYYAASAVDGSGLEGALSYLVRAPLPAGTESGSVRLQRIRAVTSAAAVRVYRGTSPQRLRRVTEIATTASEWLDAGAVESLTPPVDDSYDHARILWRMELMPPVMATEFGPNTIGNGGLGLAENGFRGGVVRVVAGHGAGQERTITSNSATVLTVEPEWRTAPDSTSRFVIAEAGWNSAAVTNTGESTFLGPNRPNEVIEIVGLPVNVLGVEGAVEDALVTRHALLIGSHESDSDVPGMPTFAITTLGRGEFEFGGIAFDSLDNTHTIQSGTLRVHYWDELKSPTALALTNGIDAVAGFLDVNAVSEIAAGDLLQLGRELMRVLAVTQSGLRLEVERGIHETIPAGHSFGEAVYPLSRHVSVFPFPPGFFGSSAGSGFLPRIPLPNARIAAVEFFVSNRHGDSPTSAQSYTTSADSGVRTMSGGQYVIQFGGTLAVTNSIAPPLVTDGQRVVRDARAMVGRAPVGCSLVVRLKEGDSTYSEFAIPSGSRWSNTVSGFGRRPLAEGAELTVSIVSVGTAGGSDPGQDLTVTIRL